ncbi:MAG: YciI family protein [bacterium]
MSDNAFVLYVILLTKNPGRPFTDEIVRAHVAHIKALDEREQLVLCGPFLDWDGGMIVIRAASLDEARSLAEADPFITGGFETCEVRTLHRGCRENGYLLDS